MVKKKKEVRHPNFWGVCDYCKQEYSTYRSPRATCQSRFCSHKCYGADKLGPFIVKNGYVLIKKPSHPRASVTGYVREHLLVMEEKIGRPVLKTESVHHIDGDKTNNHPDNLGLFATHSEHLRHEWANGTLRKTNLGKHHPSYKGALSKAESPSGQEL